MRVCENEDCVKMRLLRRWDCVKMRLFRKWEVGKMRYCYGKSFNILNNNLIITTFFIAIRRLCQIQKGK